MNRDDLIRLTRVRIGDARVLLARKRNEGAYYICGYSVECALKACIAKKTKKYDFPDKATASESFTHDLTKLMKIAGLQAQLDAECKKDPMFRVNWALTRDWNEGSRYELRSRKEARGLYSAIVGRKHGMLRWLRLYW